MSRPHYLIPGSVVKPALSDSSHLEGCGVETQCLSRQVPGDVTDKVRWWACLRSLDVPMELWNTSNRVTKHGRFPTQPNTHRHRVPKFITIRI